MKKRKKREVKANMAKNRDSEALCLRVLDQTFCVHRLAHLPVLDHLDETEFFWLGRTDDEISLVCEANIQIQSEETESGWSCLKVLGPLDFSMTGVIAGLSEVLANEQISIFALSTFDTDYLLVKTSNLERALAALRGAGYDIEK